MKWAVIKGKLAYVKCPKISNILFHSILGKFLLFMHLLLKIPSGMANSVDPDQTVPSGAVCTVCICHFVSHFGVRIFRTFTVIHSV